MKTSEKWFLGIVFVLVNLFFIVQHRIDNSWDFMVYALNAKHFFGSGAYFEWMRPPLASLLIGVFGFLGWAAAEYFFIILVAFLHLASCFVLAKRWGLNPAYFYLVSVSPFFLLEGMIMGTELLSLTLVQFAVGLLDYSGVFLGLAFLTRYTSIIFAPLMLFNNWKRALRNILFFGVVAGLWLLYNHLVTGNFLTSIIDVYAKDVKFRGYMNMPFRILDILAVGNYLLFFGIAGFVFSVKKFKLRKIDYVMMMILVFVLVSYAKTPFKTSRYLFLLLVPLSYYSCVLIQGLRKRRMIVFALLLVSFLFAGVYVSVAPVLDKSIFYDAMENLPDNCSAVSNFWVPLNYYGLDTGFAVRKELLNKSVGDGYRHIIYNFVAEPDYSGDLRFLRQFPVIYSGEKFVILGDLNKCTFEKNLDSTYLFRLKETLLALGYGNVDISNHNILFGPPL